jgi:4-hydroxy-tetrahydrodipicolinate synthase
VSFLLKGVYHILVTPFDEREELDVMSLRKAVRFAIDSGVDGVVALAIMGESHKLLDRERDEVVAAVVDETAATVPVVVGCTADSTLVALRRAEAAQRLGASAVMVAPPRNVRGHALLRRHYEAMSRLETVPVVVQDEPITSGVELDASFIGELLSFPNFCGVKVEEVPSPAKISRILVSHPAGRCLGGLGGLYFLEELGRGAVGIMTGFGMPEALVRIQRDFDAGRLDQARREFYRYLPLVRFEAQLGVGGVSIRKLLLADRGIIASPTVRQPAAPVDERTLAELRGLIHELEVG